MLSRAVIVNRGEGDPVAREGGRRCRIVGSVRTAGQRGFGKPDLRKNRADRVDVERFAVMRSGHERDFVRLQSVSFGYAFADRRRRDERFGSRTQVYRNVDRPMRKDASFGVDGASRDPMDRFDASAAHHADVGIAVEQRRYGDSVHRPTFQKAPESEVDWPCSLGKRADLVLLIE